MLSPRLTGASRSDVSNSAFEAGLYRVAFDGKASYPLGGRFEALLSFPEIDDGQPWDTASDGAASADTTIRVASIAYDFTGGTIEQLMTVTCVGNHNLAIGQYVRIRMDSDLTASTAFATGSTIGAINAEYKVEVITEGNVFDPPA